MASPTDNSKPTGHGYSKKKKKKKNPKPKPKPNLKTDGSKPNPRMAAKTEIRNGETELITSASNSSNIDHRQSDWRSVVASASPVESEIGIAQIGSEIPSSPCRLDVLPSPTTPPLSLSLPAPSTLRYFIFTLHFSSL